MSTDAFDVQRRRRRRHRRVSATSLRARAFAVVAFAHLAATTTRTTWMGSSWVTPMIGVDASDYHATDSLALSNAFERAHERANRREVSVHETAHAEVSAIGAGGVLRDDGARRDAARGALTRLASRAKARAVALESDRHDGDDGDIVMQRAAAREEYALLHRALMSVEVDEEEVERSQRASSSPRRAALGEPQEKASSWLDFSDGLLESIKMHGLPGGGGRPAVASKDEIDEATQIATWRNRARQTSTTKTPTHRDAKERLAPTRAWFAAKPKQPDVYWDVDLEKIQRARETVAARAVEQGGTNFDFEITDMPIVAKSSTTSKRAAALGAAATTTTDDDDDENTVAKKEEDASEANAANGTAVYTSEDALDNAFKADDGTIHSFSNMLEEWTKKAVAHVDKVATKARQTASYVSEKAIAAEEDLLMKHIDVKFYVDFADPRSLEALLGPYERLSSNKLGPVRWAVVPFVNVGQAHNATVNCLYNGHARHLSCTANVIAACAAQNLHEFPDTMRAFTSCYGVQLLKLESQQAFTFGRHEAALSDAQGQCCRAVTSTLDALDANATTPSKSGAEMCQAQSECAMLGSGYDLLVANGIELGSAEPRYKFLPWVTIDDKPACKHKCNLQSTLRRKICAMRTTLPADCPKFPWAQAWYDEPEVSFGGLAVVSAAVIFVTVSAFVLMREAGLKPLGLFGGEKKTGSGATSGERAELLPK